MVINQATPALIRPSNKKIAFQFNQSAMAIPIGTPNIMERLKPRTRVLMALPILYGAMILAAAAKETTRNTPELAPKITREIISTAIFGLTQATRQPAIKAS
ncbi:hypothetical protein PAPH110629_21025 [Paenibacillus phoenicis]